MKKALKTRNQSDDVRIVTETGFDCIPSEMFCLILDHLDLDSLSAAAMTCRRWNEVLQDNDILWKKYCLAIRAVCPTEVDADRKNGYTWKKTLQRNYWKPKVKLDWMTGRYSHIRSFTELPVRSMYSMDAETWGQILDAELER